MPSSLPTSAGSEEGAEIGRILEIAARKAAASSTGRESGAKRSSYRLVIKGVGTYLLDSQGSLTTDCGTEEDGTEPDLELTYASGHIFLELVYRRLNPRAAVLSGKVSFRGDLLLAKRLGAWLSDAGEEVREGERETSAQDPLAIAPRDAWQPDDDAEHCVVCSREFKLYSKGEHFSSMPLHEW
ncbi:unnamed protein product [Discosporangium mesarthrocarpum]